MRSAFIVLEGIDGAGTTTHTARLVQRLKQSGREVHGTCEPSQGPIGKLLREFLARRFDLKSGPAPSWAQMGMLFAADRIDHLNSEVLPKLEQGAVVVSDRYDYSSVAYQSCTADAPLEDAARWLRELNRFARRPDLTVVLDISSEEAARRRSTRMSEELFEGRSLQERLAHAYRDLATWFPEDPIVYVDSSGSIDEVAATILKHVEGVLAK